MGVFVVTKKEEALKAVFPKADFVSSLSEHSPGSGDMTYIDISPISHEDLKKNLAQIKKICGSFWGIIDPKGTVTDPAELFFEGASDYIGPSFIKASLTVDAKRIKEVFAWQKNVAASAAAASGDDDKASASGGTGFLKAGIKLPAESFFPGWKKVTSGKSMPFYLLYCALQGKFPLDSRLEPKVLAQVHKRFIALMENYMDEPDGLFWMDSGKDCLFLLPPKAKSADAAIKACMSMIVSAPLLVMESLGVSFPVNFTFALHYGSLNYKPPGKTGTVVSDAVNFIFHLGTKKAETGRITISGEVPDKTVPAILHDCFVPAGEFEGRKIWHTKKFTYSKPWV